MLYKQHLEPYISEIHIESSRILPIYLHVPGYPMSAHFNIYLPTSGKDSEYIECLAQLKSTIEDVIEDCSDTLIFIRGDANASYHIRGKSHSDKRDKLFNHFANSMNLHNIDLHHKTYHHFMGEGSSDSSIDVLLQSSD